MPEKIKLPHPLLLIIGIGFLLYARSFSFEYTNFDDNALIQDNQSYISNISNIGDAFGRSVFITGSDVFYRPVETVWFILNAQVGGADLFIYHFSSLLLHLLSVYLIYILLLKLNNSKEASLFLSLLFLVHPVLTQAVAWVPGVVDILETIFAVAAFIFFLEFVKNNQRKDFVLHLLFFVLALYTKEIAVGIGVVCIAHLHFIEKEKPISYNKKVLVAGWAVIGLVWFLMRDAALQGQQLRNAGEMIPSLFSNLPALVQYVGKVIFPFSLSVMPVMQDTSFIYGAIAILLTAAAVFFSKERRNSRLVFALIWVVVFLLPTLITTSAFRIHQPYEHRMYLPMLGFLFLAAETDWIRFFSTEKTVYRVVAPLTLVLFFILAFRHEQVFSNTKSFLDNAVVTSPTSSLAHRNLGIYYQDKNLLQEASEEYLKALALNPHEKDLHNNLGVIYDSRNRKDLAEKEYLTEVRMNPGNSQALHNLGVICAAAGRNEEAEKYFRQALQVRSTRGTYEQLALLYQKLNRKEDLEKIVNVLRQMDAQQQALQGDSSALAPDPPMPADPIALGRQLMQTGKVNEAENVFRQVLMKDSLNAQALFNMGLIYYSAKLLPVAEALWRKAVLIDSTYVDAYNNLAICFAQQGKNAEAEVVLKKIISSNPDYMDGYFNLANFYARSGREKEAQANILELKKHGIGKVQFVQRGIKLSPELEKIFDK